MKTTFKVWNCGNWMEIQMGQEVTIFRCGSGHAAFGERAHLERTTKQHLIFVTESGAQVKTAIDNLHHIVGKAAKERYCVSIRKYDDFEGIIHEDVKFWNNNKCKFEYK